MGEWQFAQHPLHLQAPRQGFADEERIVRWRTSGLLGVLTVVGRNADVEEIVAGLVWPNKKEKAMSPVLTASIISAGP